MKPGDKVRIHSTEELPTKHHGKIGYFLRRHIRYPDLCLVYVLGTQTDGYYDISQLTKKEE